MAKRRSIETHTRDIIARQETAPFEIVAISELKLPSRNAHQHSKAQIEAIAASIKRFGFINPLVVDDNNTIRAGCGRFAAANLLGLERVPTVRVANLSDAELRAYMLVDNKLVEKAGWDRQMLAVELKELEVSLPKIGLSLEVTGFDPGEIDSLTADFCDQQRGRADEIPALDNQQTISRPGDLFVLGRHKLLIGDPRSPDAYKRLMDAQLADMAFLDPPYSVPVAGHAGARGHTKRREFVCASGEMTSQEFREFLEGTLSLCASHTVDGAVHFVCADWRYGAEVYAAGATTYDELKNVCVWIKDNDGQGTFYRNQHELVFVFKHGKAAHFNTFKLGQNGRTRSNVWRYAGANSSRASRMKDFARRRTVKPTSMVADAMRDCSRRGSIILDAFVGSGTTIIAAEQTGRMAYCLEHDAGYADAAIRRWQRFTRRDANLDGSGQTFDELAAGDRGSRKRGDR